MAQLMKLSFAETFSKVCLTIGHWSSAHPRFLRRSCRDFRLRNDLYCVGCGVKLYSLTCRDFFLHIWRMDSSKGNSHSKKARWGSIAKQALQWMPHGRWGRGQPKNYIWKRNPENEMWTGGYKWRAGGRLRRQHRAGGGEWGAWPMLHPNSISDDDQRTTPGKDIWRKRCRQQDTRRAVGRRRQQHRTELKMEKSGLWWPTFHTLGPTSIK